jgi:hypothetical protein
MQVYTYSEARQKLSSLLDEADVSGKVLIRRRDGRMFSLSPERSEKSPLDVPSITAQVTTEELVSLVRNGRARSTASMRFRGGRRRPSATG